MKYSKPTFNESNVLSESIRHSNGQRKPGDCRDGSDTSSAGAYEVDE